MNKNIEVRMHAHTYSSRISAQVCGIGEVTDYCGRKFSQTYAVHVSGGGLDDHGKPERLGISWSSYGDYPTASEVVAFAWALEAATKLATVLEKLHTEPLQGTLCIKAGDGNVRVIQRSPSEDCQQFDVPASGVIDWRDLPLYPQDRAVVQFIVSAVHEALPNAEPTQLESRATGSNTSLSTAAATTEPSPFV